MIFIVKLFDGVTSFCSWEVSLCYIRTKTRTCLCAFTWDWITPNSVCKGTTFFIQRTLLTFPWCQRKIINVSIVQSGGRSITSKTTTYMENNCGYFIKNLRNVVLHFCESIHFCKSIHFYESIHFCESIHFYESSFFLMFFTVDGQINHSVSNTTVSISLVLKGKLTTRWWFLTFSVSNSDLLTIEMM